MEKMIPLEGAKLELDDLHDAVRFQVISPFEKLAKILNDFNHPGIEIKPDEYGEVLSLMVEGAISRLQQARDRGFEDLGKSVSADNQEADHA